MLSYRRLVVQYGAVLPALLAPVALVVACGASSFANEAGGEPGYDSGTGYDTGVNAPDTGSVTIDGSADSGVHLPTTALFVQGSPSLANVRLCWALDGVNATILPFPSDGAMPGSNYPGVPGGSVTPMDDASSLAGHALVLYAVDALNFARIEQGQVDQGQPPLTCDQIICGPGSSTAPCLRYDLDYWPLASIPAGSVLPGHDNVIAISGCTPNDPNATTALCGASWTLAGGNLHADVLQLAPSTAGAGAIAVQAAQLSPALASLEGDGGSAVVTFGAQDADGGVTPVATLRGEGDLYPPADVAVGGGLAVYGQLGFAVDVPGYDGGAGHLWMSLAEAQQLVDPTQDPTQFFGQARPYLLAVLGDPSQTHAFGPTVDDAGYSGAGLHVLVVAAPLPEAGAGDAASPTGDL